jgi:hypothetical protein
VTDQNETTGYGSDSEVAKFFSVHIKSLRRWDGRPELGFPPPIRVNGRKYRPWAAVHEFARRAATAHAGKPLPRDRFRKPDKEKSAAP